LVGQTIKAGFKKTEIGEIPEEWTVRQLGDKDVSTIVMGQSPPSSSYNTSGKGLPFLQGNADFGVLYPTPRVYCTKPLKLSETGDILISVRAPVGELNISSFKCIIGRGLAAVRNVQRNTYGKYLYYYMKNGIDRLKASSTGSTFKAVGRDPMMKFKIALPSLPEQQKIAEILSDTDSLIESLDKLISKKRNIKQGLMKTLLTRGIGHTKFKETEIGEIPEEWECVTLGDPKISTITRAGGTPLRSVRKYYENGNIPFVKIEDMVVSGKYLTDTDEKITDEGVRNSSAWVIQPDSILYSMYASYGEVSINKLPVATNQAILSIIPNKYQIDVNYLYYQLKQLKSNLKKYLRSTTQNNLNANIVKALKIPFAPLLEQQKIAEILSDADKEIEVLEQKRYKYEMLKTGMMQQLLTGGIRVK
jgi:type I restriction enzyme S subunit